jgi:hypothetical protein
VINFLRRRHGSAGLAVASCYLAGALAVIGWALWSMLTQTGSFAGLWIVLVSLPFGAVVFAVMVLLPDHLPGPDWSHPVLFALPFIAVCLAQGWWLRRNL